MGTAAVEGLAGSCGGVVFEAEEENLGEESVRAAGPGADGVGRANRFGVCSGTKADLVATGNEANPASEDRGATATDGIPVGTRFGDRKRNDGLQCDTSGGDSRDSEYAPPRSRRFLGDAKNDS